MFSLEVTPEPKMQWQSVIQFRVDKAVDDQGQALVQKTGGAGPEAAVMGQVMLAGAGALAVNSDYGMPTGHLRQLPVRLKPAKQSSKLLKELSGSITAQVQTPPAPLMTVDNILKAAGRTVKGPDGASVKVLETSHSNGLVKVRLQAESPNQAMGAWGGANVRVIRRMRVLAGGGAVVMESIDQNGPGAYSLQDDKGRPFNLLNANPVIQANANGTLIQEMHLTYQAQKGQTEPAKLVYTGSRTVLINIPFTLKDVPLP